MKKIVLFLVSFLGLNLLFVSQTFAICPLCVIAVGAGIGLSRWLGVDDTITGVWIGGLIVSMIAWTEGWLEKKKIRFKGRLFADILLYYGLIVIPLYYSGIIGNPSNTLGVFGLDKLLFGIVAGSLAFWFGTSWYFYLKEKNNGRAHFPFQKVAMPVLPLIILSAIFYFLTK